MPDFLFALCSLSFSCAMWTTVSLMWIQESGLADISVRAELCFWPAPTTYGLFYISDIYWIEFAYIWWHVWTEKYGFAHFFNSTNKTGWHLQKEEKSEVKMSFCFIYLKISVFMVQWQATGIYFLLHKKERTLQADLLLVFLDIITLGLESMPGNLTLHIFCLNQSRHTPSHLGKTCVGRKFAFRVHFYYLSPQGMSGEAKSAEGLWRLVGGCFSGLACTSVK